MTYAKCLVLTTTYTWQTSTPHTVTNAHRPWACRGMPFDDVCQIPNATLSLSWWSFMITVPFKFGSFWIQLSQDVLIPSNLSPVEENLHLLNLFCFLMRAPFYKLIGFRSRWPNELHIVLFRFAVRHRGKALSGSYFFKHCFEVVFYLDLILHFLCCFLARESESKHVIALLIWLGSVTWEPKLFTPKLF